MQGAERQSDVDHSFESELDRDWAATAIRAIPIGLLVVVASVGLIFWQSDPQNRESSPYLLDAVRAEPGPELASDARDTASDARDTASDARDTASDARDTAAAPGGGDGAGPGLQYDRDRPQLYVQGTVNTGDGSGPATTSEGSSSTETGEDGRTTTIGDGPTTTRATGSSAASTADRGRSTTTRRSPTTSNSGGSSTAGAITVRRTTAPPTTARATTTARPTTAAPTTAAPTTAAPTPAGGTCAGSGEFERVFRDDFNGSSVSGNWSRYNSSGNSNYGLRRPSAISVSNGHLVITAKMENGSLVSGGMSHGLDQKYGKWVARVRTDNDPSQAVSGVVLTWPQSGVHPRDGENNIYETLVKTANRNPFYTFIHKPFGSKSDQEYYKHNADGSQFQTMTMEWTPSRITIIREGPGGSGRDVWTVNETGADLIPDVAHHMSIQLDAWKHSIGGPVRMEVDYVEVHKYCG